MNTILVTGGAGYVGCVLVPKLLAAGHRVIVYDCMYFGAEGLPSHPGLEVLAADIRDTKTFARALKGVETVIHLACISNDPSFELDPEIGKSINYDCFEPMVKACVAAGVRRFIDVSTSSVYGVSEVPDVTEEHPLVPLTDYSRYKGLCEGILRAYQSAAFTTVIIRPATVCGYSPRMRLDLAVNLLTNHAINKRTITIFGGSQKRPNIHIDDITDLYVQLLKEPDERIAGETFNAGYQNHAVSELAAMVKTVVEQECPALGPIRIETTSSDDLRSYHVSSEKIGRVLGFRPRRTIEDAIRDLCRAFMAGLIPNSQDDDRYFNVRVMKNMPAHEVARLG